LIGHYDEKNKPLGYEHDTLTNNGYRPIEHTTGIDSHFEIKKMYHCPDFNIAVSGASRHHIGKVVYAIERYT